MSSQGKSGQGAQEGLRERKKRETRHHIAAVGMQLFLKHGYDGTTLDTIAEQAGISRRTFFSYFKSKDDIILAMQAADWEAMIADLRQVSPQVAPLDAVVTTMVRHISRYESEQMKALDAVMLASETLMSRKQASYAMQEASLHAALCQIWPAPERQSSLRIVAMVSVGAIRLALEAWRQQSGVRSLASFLEETFTRLRSEISSA